MLEFTPEGQRIRRPGLRTSARHCPMGNRFNYRCPQCASPDEIEICAFVSICLTCNGAEIAEEVQDLDGSC
jgi:hypothetical protein